MENKKNDNQQPTVASAHHPFYLGEMKKGMFACWTVPRNAVTIRKLQSLTIRVRFMPPIPRLSRKAIT